MTRAPVPAVTALTASLALLAACPDREVAQVEPDQSGEQRTEIPLTVERAVDILFVVDDSRSMSQEQESLAANFPRFIEVLDDPDKGGLPDVHLGVVSSNVGTGPEGGDDGECAGQGDDGVLRVPSGCPPLTDGKRYIADVRTDADTRSTNYAGDLADQFSCMARLGTGGCGFEQHLESMRRALSNTNENAGFLRDEAFLAVVFIQDEDDCSARDRGLFNPAAALDDRGSRLGELSSFRCFEFGTACRPDDERALGPRQDCAPDDDSRYVEQVTSYVDFLKGLKRDPARVIVAAITGPEGPVTVGVDPAKEQLWVEPACVVCEGGGTDCDAARRSDGDALVAAAPAVRMHAFLDGFPARSTYQPICAYDPATDQVDLRGALTQIAVLLEGAIGTSCMRGELADVDPGADGIQPDCRVSDVIHLDRDDEVEHAIPPCDGAGPTCWRVVPDDRCHTETGLSLEIDRAGEPADDTTVVARCLLR